MINYNSILTKLKLNKINATADELEGKITIGKVKTNFIELSLAVFLIALSLVLVYSYSTMQGPGRISKLIGFLCVGPGIAGIYLLIHIRLFKSRNNSSKIISKFGIKFQDKNGVVEIPSVEIINFKTEVSTEDMGTTGSLYVLAKNGDQKLIVSLFNDNRSFLTNDLDFLAEQFRKITQIQ